jgi:predicted transcriptional regulator
MTGRTLVSLGDERIAQLDQMARQRGRSRSALVREAVDRLIADQATDQKERILAGLRAGFGLWKDRTDIGDAVEWQRRERASWTRPWDDDYDQVKAEFPDIFDEEDDRQRAVYLEMESQRSSRTQGDR